MTGTESEKYWDQQLRNLAVKQGYETAAADDDGDDEPREYRVTFGQRYRRETHPTFPAAHPDGWVTILAYDDAGARAVAFSMFEQAWSFMYGPSDRPQTYWDDTFPGGELARITLEPESGDVCRVVDIGGETVRLRGSEPPSPEAVAALADLVAAARKRMGEDPS